MRHADAGYKLAVETAHRNDLKLPLLENKVEK
jgi:urocanate hydratase